MPSVLFFILDVLDFAWRNSISGNLRAGLRYLSLSLRKSSTLCKGRAGNAVRVVLSEVRRGAPERFADPLSLAGFSGGRWAAFGAASRRRLDDPPAYTYWLPETLMQAGSKIWFFVSGDLSWLQTGAVPNCGSAGLPGRRLRKRASRLRTVRVLTREDVCRCSHGPSLLEHATHHHGSQRGIVRQPG
jgi:hypothetical protein